MKRLIFIFTFLIPSITLAFNFSQDSKVYAKKLSRRPGASLTEQTHKLLTRAQEDLSSGATKNAFKLLNKLEKRTEGTPSEHAQVVQAIGYAYAQKEDEDKALKYFEKTLDLDALPESPTLSVIYIVGQLYTLKGNHKKSEEILKFFLSIAKDPNPQAYAMLASSLMEQDKKKEALKAIQKAIDLSPKPNESWLALAVSLYFANERYAEAAKVLQILVAQNPKKGTYWKQWAQSYLSANKEKEGLVALEIGHIGGVLKTDKDIKNATQIMMSTDIPYKAALWMEKKLSPKERKNIKSQKLLASAYMMARENNKAVNVLKEIHKNHPEVKSSIQLGQLLLESEKWKEARDVFDKAYSLKPNLDQKKEIVMGLGISYYNLGKIKRARESFVQIADKSESAQSWLNFIQSQSPAEEM